MKDVSEIPLSILDLSPIVTGGDAARSLRNSLKLAQHAEAWGYHRYWLAEHHNMAGIASAATSVVIGYIAAGTKKIRVGSGGIMLPNHAPLVIAEQFGTLEALFPGRIDLGLGRAPGGDRVTAHALRRDLGNSADRFPQDVAELQGYFQPPRPNQLVQAVPGAGLNIPLYLLGSSDFSARLAAALGLPFAFASHFAPAFLHEALEIYRSHFRPSETLHKPYAMVAANVLVAETDLEAQRLFTSRQQFALAMVRGERPTVPPPVDSMESRWSPREEAAVAQMTLCSAVGAPETVQRDLEAIVHATEADEIIATALIFDDAARLKSFEMLAELHAAAVH
jgi:luciferase family oxidoreductase group 1